MNRISRSAVAAAAAVAVAASGAVAGQSLQTGSQPPPAKVKPAKVKRLIKHRVGVMIRARGYWPPKRRDTQLTGLVGWYAVSLSPAQQRGVCASVAPQHSRFVCRIVVQTKRAERVRWSCFKVAEDGDVYRIAFKACGAYGKRWKQRGA